jgi:hypothetical protein
MTTTTPDRTHPITAAIAELRERLAELAETPVWSLDATEAAHTLQEIARLAAALAELELRVAAHADTLDVGAHVGATSTANWWAHQTLTEYGTATRRLQLAHALNTDEHAEDRARVRAALTAGDITEEAAHIIVRALDALPDDLDTPTRRRAEAVMLHHARDLGPRRLRAAGKALLAVIAPDRAHAHEEKILTAEEQRARAAIRLLLWDDGHGTTIGEFTLPTIHAAMLRKMLMALAAPKHQRATTHHHTTATDTPTDTPDAGQNLDAEDTPAAADDTPAPEQTDEELPPWRKPSPQRMGEALAELIERFAGGPLPEIGGTPATIVVTMTLDQLLGAPGAVQLDTGHTISAGQARRLACQAGILPMVLGGDSVPLDLGRTRRLHDRHQRLAIQHRDRTCTAHGCDVPGIRCHVHHRTPWSHGGPTTIDNARLLCPRHHQHAHDPAYHHTERPDGQIEFHRRT